MRLIQFLDRTGAPAVGLVESSHRIRTLESARSVRELALRAIERSQPLAACAGALASDETLAYDDLIRQERLLPPIDHPDPAHLLLTGTGLTHLGSADTRDEMHAKASAPAPKGETDSMKMFRLGLEGGKPPAGQPGVQPEWFYKGDGRLLVAPGQPLAAPDFALDGGEEPELAAIYLIDPEGAPCRIGFALGNEFSDHVTERQNYLYLAHSKLRPCSLGPELLIGSLPDDIQGVSRIWRNGQAIWERPFLTGERNMCHSIANLEAHHFKYKAHRRPGDIHVHFLGTATLSFADGVRTRPGDLFEIEAPPFGRPLRNAWVRAPAPLPRVRTL